MNETIRIKQATKTGYIECCVGGVADFSYPSSKTRRGRVQGGGNICPTITAEQFELCRIEKCYVSKKGVDYICHPKRGMATDINADIIQPLTAKGQANWTGSFVSKDIDHLEKSTELCGSKPTKIVRPDGTYELYDGETEMEQKYRIRKLTPTECARLMNFDEDCARAMLETNSQTQVYKECGNSIVVSCLIAIFSQLGIAGVKKWNDMDDDERYRIIYDGCVPNGIAYKVETPGE